MAGYQIRDVKSIYIHLSHREVMALDLVRDCNDLIVGFTMLRPFSYIIFPMASIGEERRVKALGFAVEVLRRASIPHACRLRSRELVRFQPVAVTRTSQMMLDWEAKLFDVHTPVMSGPHSVTKADYPSTNTMLSVIRELGLVEAKEKYPLLMRSVVLVAEYIREVEGSDRMKSVADPADKTEQFDHKQELLGEVMSTI